MDLEKLIELHDKQTDTHKICTCDVHIFHSECIASGETKCSLDHEVQIVTHPPHSDCNCTLAIAIKTFQLKTIGKIVDHGKLDEAGQIIRTIDLGLDGSTITPKNFMAIHSELYNYMNGMEDSAVLSLYHQFQLLIDAARIGSGIVHAFYSDRLKRLSEEKRAELREQDKEFDKTHRYDSTKNVKAEAKKEDIKKDILKMMALLKKLENA